MHHLTCCRLMRSSTFSKRRASDRIAIPSAILKKLRFLHLRHAHFLLWGVTLFILWGLRQNTTSPEEPWAFHVLPFFGQASKEESLPWMGVGQPPPDIADKHVRVVVRVHHLHDAATRSLIWAMRAQAIAARYASPNAPTFTVDIVLVATEEVGVPVVHNIARGKSSASRPRHPKSVNAPRPPPPWRGPIEAPASCTYLLKQAILPTPTVVPFVEMTQARCSVQGTLIPLYHHMTHRHVDFEGPFSSRCLCGRDHCRLFQFGQKAVCFLPMYER